MEAGYYSRASVALHWAMAAVIAAAWVLGEVMTDMARGPDRVSAQGWHALLGLLVLALLLSVIVIHSIWTLIIRPRAEAVLSQRITVTNQNVKHQVIQLRSVYVILKDHEQELCVTLCMWSLLLLGRQAWLTNKDRKLLDKDYVRIGEAQVVLPEDARVYSRPLEALPREEQDGFLPRLLMVAYNRFGLALAHGQSPAAAAAEIGQVVEGAPAAAAVRALAARHGVEMPICEQVCRVLRDAVAPRDAVAALMERARRREHD